jgi:hypothetical protein
MLKRALDLSTQYYPSKCTRAALARAAVDKIEDRD